MIVKLYSTNCPKCNVLEKKLKTSNINFSKIENFDVEKFINEGFNSAPILEVDGKRMKYTEAITWLKEHSI